MKKVLEFLKPILVEVGKDLAIKGGKSILEKMEKKWKENKKEKEEGDKSA